VTIRSIVKRKKIVLPNEF